MFSQLIKVKDLHDLKKNQRILLTVGRATHENDFGREDTWILTKVPDRAHFPRGSFSTAEESDTDSKGKDIGGVVSPFSAA